VRLRAALFLKKQRFRKARGDKDLITKPLRCQLRHGGKLLMIKHLGSRVLVRRPTETTTASTLATRDMLPKSRLGASNPLQQRFSNRCSRLPIRFPGLARSGPATAIWWRSKPMRIEPELQPELLERCAEKNRISRCDAEEFDAAPESWPRPFSATRFLEELSR
jgi:hypothetical protein